MVSICLKKVRPGVGVLIIKVVNGFFFSDWQTNDEQVLNMYQYLQWPDVGIPKDSLTIFELIHTVKKMNSSSAIVHCCAGVDRTGSFIALARLFDDIHSKPEKLNVFDTVLNLRKDRKLMVKTLKFFVHSTTVAIR